MKVNICTFRHYLCSTYRLNSYFNFLFNFLIVSIFFKSWVMLKGGCASFYNQCSGKIRVTALRYSIHLHLLYTPWKCEETAADPPKPPKTNIFRRFFLYFSLNKTFLNHLRPISLFLHILNILGIKINVSSKNVEEI